MMLRRFCWLALAAGLCLSQASAQFVGPDVRLKPGNYGILSRPDQTQSGGVNLQSYNLGTPASSSTITIDCGRNPAQYLTNNAAFTLGAPLNDGTCLVLMTNGASAGTVSFSGFTVGASTGDALTTTNGNKFTFSIWRINGVAGYRVAAHQ